MKKAAKFAVGAASALVIVGSGVVSWIVHPSGPERSETPITYYEPAVLTVGASGDSSTRVTYTCADPTGHVETCSTSVPAGVWSTRLSVPQGTVVRVQARGGMLAPKCWIEADALVLDESDGDGMCKAVAGK